MFMLGILGWIFRPGDIESWGLVLLATLPVALNAMNQLFMAPLRVAGSLTAWNALRLIPQVTYAGMLIVMVLTNSLTVERGVLVLVAGNVLTTLAAVALDRRLGPAPRLNDSAGKASVKFGRRLLVAVLPQQIGPRVDQLMLSISLVPAVLGVYSVAVSVASIVTALSLSVEQVLYPRFIRAGSTRRGTTRSALTFILLATVAAALLYAVAPVAIEVLFGRAYSGAMEPLGLLMLASIVRVAGAVLAAATKAAGHLRLLAGANFTGLVVTLVVFAVLVPTQGITGAAGASLAGACATFATLIWRRRDDRPEERGAWSDVAVVNGRGRRRRHCMHGDDFPHGLDTAFPSCRDLPGVPCA